MFYLLQTRIKYPLNTLSGEATRDTLRERLVAPVVQSGDKIFAFRIIWRVDSDNLAHAWNDILSQRHLCDQIVAQAPSLHLFVSCICGVFNKSWIAGTWPDQLKPVYPAVSYWMVQDDANIGSYSELVQRLLAACPSAQCKMITSSNRRLNDEPVAINCASLYVALKDHNSGFINHKINRCRAGVESVDGASPPRNAKLAVARHSRYMQPMLELVVALRSCGLCIHLHELETD